MKRIIGQIDEDVADLLVDTSTSMADIVAVTVPWISVVSFWSMVAEIIYKTNNKNINNCAKFHKKQCGGVHF